MARYLGYKKPKHTAKTIKKLLSYLGSHKLSILFVIILVTISSFANITGTYFLKPIINEYIVPKDIPGLIKILCLVGLIYLIGALCTFGYSQLMVKTSQKIIKEIREDLFCHIQTLPLSYFDAHTHGELMSHFTNDVDTVAEALNNSITTLIQSFIMTIGTIFMLFVLNIWLSLIVILFIGAMLLFIKYNSSRSKLYFQQQQEYIGDLNGFIEEMISGQKVEKVFHHETQNFEEFCKRNEKLQKTSTKALAYSGLTVPVIVSMSYFNYALTACIGGILALSGYIDIGSLSSYLVYVRQSAMPMNQFTMQLNFILAALSGAERIFEVMEMEPEIDKGTITLCYVKNNEQGELEECKEYTGLWAWKDTSLIPLRGDVRFEDVVFYYNTEKIILNQISLYAKPGQKIAFVGSTGAGKTTIINLINRFYEIQEGRITYDGIDIRMIKKADLRRSLGMVLQDTHLFTGTIADNILYGNLHATKEQMKQAAKIANADSFIRRLPDGYDTYLEGDGANLSQGQRQLLAIARAAIADPPVLILDEATSSIDTRTERLIEQGMDTLMLNRTVFVIAHRLSTVRNAKAILVLEYGEIIERGNHEELLKEQGRYYQLYTGQFELE